METTKSHLATKFYVQEGIDVFLNDDGSISIHKIFFNEVREEIEDVIFTIEISSLSGLRKALYSLAKEIKEEGIK